MKKFAKSILNYFATYTETRFRFQTKIDYRWTNDSLTNDLSVFPDFEKKLLKYIADGQPFNFSIKRKEYIVCLDKNDFKDELLKRLRDNYNKEFIENCIKKEGERLLQNKDNIILGINQKDGKITETIRTVDEKFEKEAVKEGLRQFNLSFRREIKSVLLKLQQNKIDDLKEQLKFSNVPNSSLNINIIEQDFFNSSQELIKTCKDNIDTFYNNINKLVSDISEDLIMFDLYDNLRAFFTLVDVGTLYLFFHEIGFFSDNNEESNPLFLIEIDIQYNQEEICFKSPRNIVMINTPAINRFELQTILTTPRAARFNDSIYYLGNVENFLQNTYNYFNKFLLEHSFPAIKREGLPEIRFRIGLQIVNKEDKKLLDYSELITHIDAGGGKKLIDFITNYVSGNVKNTQKEVDESYNKKYPKRSVYNLINSIPINLDQNQKRILLALENPKNEVVVVDGPPGTGKSHTIMAITYWANMKNKSLVITSHKKAALDVIDNMMTESFKKLHPTGKPSVLKLVDEEVSVNTFENTLSNPVITAANNRINEFNEDAIKKDLSDWENKLDKEYKSYWNNADDYKDFIDNLFQLELLREELNAKNIIKDEIEISKIDNEKCIDFNALKIFSEVLQNSRIQSLSVEQLNFIIENKGQIQEILDACDFVNKSAFKEIDISKLKIIELSVIDRFTEQLISVSNYLKDSSLIYSDTDKLKFKFLKTIFRKGIKKEIRQNIDELNNLEFKNIIHNICILLSKNKNSLTIADILQTSLKLKELQSYCEYYNYLKKTSKSLSFTELNVPDLFNFFTCVDSLIKEMKDNLLTSILVLREYFCNLLLTINVDFNNLKTLYNLFNPFEINQKVLQYIQLFYNLSKNEYTNMPDQNFVKEYNNSLHQEIEFLNDKRLLNLNNYTGDIERIKNTIRHNKRLTLDELKVLLNNISCIIANPSSLSKYFPMEDDVIDLLVIDEASQVSIADSISLILRAKQVIVFGDELQYGAVSAINVNSRYSKDYFKEIVNSYSQEYDINIDDKIIEQISDEVSNNPDEENEIAGTVYKPEEGQSEWLKTFNIRTSTLSFAKAIKNYSTSLNIHFRSFPEIIEYSNEIFYKPSQIPLIINRIRTKPINEVLRFIKVDTRGNSGNKINIDEIYAIKKDIDAIINSGFKGTIGIITSFRDQKYKMQEILSKEMTNYHNLKMKHKFEIWFVGDVQGEERDIIYYSFVEDKKIENGDLRTVYPTINGTADNIRNLKMQRLNVGFSRAKDVMVFVHSMPIKEYSHTRLGDALKIYKQILENTQDNYIEDEHIFGSPAEKRLYTLLINTEFYKKNKNNIKLIAQFPIGKYLKETLKKYVPEYRVDFLMTLSKSGKENSLILEYDGVEFHTKNPGIITEHNFSQQYLDYDIQRQLELESYGYKFLRINKFTLRPKTKKEIEVDILNRLLENKFK